ncbi:phosphatase PAP2 family protein [Lacticaseibacillus daqingensis]|uniref:phosphatase PAP2 family protein n=1 Tax=Lacticaseibacillus daqingensis TaxID=2486014 RepID=UPI0013DE0D0C|nr:phosphatase PAP2 family protein [Lacticaseibacillus daqingensis]
MRRPKYPLILAAGGLVLFIPLLVGVWHDATWVQALDHAIVAQVTAYRPEWLTELMLAVTNCGNPLVIVGLGLVIAAVLFYYRKKRYAVFAALSIVGMSGVNHLIKQVVHRLRPFIADPTITPLTRIGGYSFPSGHASGTVLLWGTVILLAVTLVDPGHRRRGLIALSVVMIGLTGISRIYVQVHYPTDVLAGQSSALVGLMLLWWLMWPWLTRVTPTGWVPRRQ